MDLSSPVQKLFADQAQFLARALARETMPYADDWWIAELMPSAIALEAIPLSHSPFGFVISAESDRTDRIRSVVQPGPLAPPGQLEQVLARQGKYGEEAVALLRTLGPESGGRLRGDWEIAAGDGPLGVRVYAFRPDRLSVAGHMRYLRSVGLWPQALNSPACDLIETLTRFSTPTGVARSFGPRPCYKLYMNSVVPLSAGSVEIAIAGQSAQTANEVRQFCAKITGATGGCPFHSWSIAVDEAGRLSDWKLELFAPGLGSSDLIAGWPGFAEFAESGRRAAHMAGISARADLISLRIREGEPEHVLYMSFEPHGYEYTLEPRAVDTLLI